MIYIPTYGRANNQVTWQNLPQSLQEQTTLVVQDREKHLYPGFPISVLPPEITTLEPTRQWMLENLAKGPFIMLDDDLVFATRRADEPTKFRESTDDDTLAMFRAIRKGLNQVAHVGVSPREGANRNVESVMWNTRVMRILAYDAFVLKRHNIRFDRLPLMIDFDVTLQLYRLGYECPLLNSWVHNQAGSNTAGGCSHYRTDQKQEEAARTLAELHPEFVTVVKKYTKTSWGGEHERYDVRVQWKRALDSFHQRTGSGT